jgi:hypothetical protein
MKQPQFVVRTAIAVAAVLYVTAGRADDRATIDRTQIIGNRELPKVLYIVPWKKPAPGDLSGVPSESVLDEALAPLDRDVFRRQVHYNALTQPGGAAQPAQSASPAVAVPSPK